VTAEVSPNATPTVSRSFGPFELLEELGRGGMGVVFKARQAALNRLVAVKLLLPGPGGAADVRRFRAGAEAAAQLDHPNIVPVYEAGEVEGQPYLCMKLIDGQDLSRHRERLLEAPKEVARVVATAARAVQHAHEHGVFHRDVKPSNILLSADGAPYLTDFGLATVPAGGRQTETGVVLGTLAYLPPEWLSPPATPSAAADVYGLGAVLYELLTGRPPVQAPTATGVLARSRGGLPLRPRRLRPAVDQALETICLKCLQPAPAERYATAALLADDLERWLKGEPILGRLPRLGFIRRMRPTRRALIRGLAWGTLLAGAGVAAFWGWRVWQGKQGEADYDVDMKDAAEALDEGNFGLAARLLEKHTRRAEAAAIDYRDERWHYLDRIFRALPEFIWTSEWEVPSGSGGERFDRLEATWTTDEQHILIHPPRQTTSPLVVLKAASGQVTSQRAGLTPWSGPSRLPMTTANMGAPWERGYRSPGGDKILGVTGKYLTLWHVKQVRPRVSAPPLADRAPPIDR
jgi:hypothetical protein